MKQAAGKGEQEASLVQKKKYEELTNYMHAKLKTSRQYVLTYKTCFLFDMGTLFG